MAFAGIFQPFARLRWIRFGLLMRDRKFSRRFSVRQTTALAPPSLRQPDDYFRRVFGLSVDNGAKRGQQHRQRKAGDDCGRLRLACAKHRRSSSRAFQIEGLGEHCRVAENQDHRIQRLQL